MSKQIKQLQMDALKKTFTGVRDLVVLNVTGVNAMLDNSVRHNLRKKNIRLQMVKNSLTRRVFGELGLTLSGDSPFWKGNSLLAWGAGSIAELSQALDAELKGKSAAQLKDKLTVKGAIADGLPVSFQVALKMPTRAQAIGRIVSLALAPASRLVSQILAPASNVAGQIKTLSEKKPEEAAPAPAAS